jgi:hypothetical protein
MSSFSQAGQDLFVKSFTKEKKNGYFVEIGSNHPINHSNTYLLEKKYNWKGLMVEYDHSFESLYKIHRPASIYRMNDARLVNYRQILDNNNFPENIDYLQIDLDVDNKSTLDTFLLLNNTVLDKYKFATITFEHDIYNSNFNNTRLQSRDIFSRRGYLCVFEDINNQGNPYEDWYVHPDLVDLNYVNRLIENNKKNYFYNSITTKSINFENIDYNLS